MLGFPEAEARELFEEMDQLQERLKTAEKALSEERFLNRALAQRPSSVVVVERRRLRSLIEMAKNPGSDYDTLWDVLEGVAAILGADLNKILEGEQV